MIQVYDLSMATQDAEPLGQLVKRLREEKGLSQQTLGERVDYKTGAGVSILRIENDGVIPGSKRLEKIANKLGVDPSVLHDAAERQRHMADAASATVGGRIERLRRQDARYSELHVQLGRLEDARARANTDFLLRLPPAPGHVVERSLGESPAGQGARTDASYRIDLTRSGITHALADPRAQSGGYRGLADAVAEGAALAAPSLLNSVNTGVNIAGLSAVLRIGQPTSRHVGGSVALAATLIAGVVASTVAIANQRQRDEFTAKIKAAEAEVAESEPVLDALEALVPEMTNLFADIAQFAGRALTRWEQRVGQPPIWDDLSSADLDTYRSMVEVAAAQLAIATISLQDLTTLREDDLEDARSEAEALLAEAKATIDSRV